MFGRAVSNENSVVGDIPETSAAFDEKDVPIYVIESNVRNKLREDMERARNEEKRLINLQKSIRRKEILKVFQHAQNYKHDYLVNVIGLSETEYLEVLNKATNGGVEAWAN